MPDIQEIHLVDTTPNYEATQVENFAAQKRGKENLAIEDKNGNYTALFSKNAVDPDQNRDLVAKMEREYRLLLALRNSDVTPIPLLFKTNDDRTESHLLTTQVPGVSLEAADMIAATYDRFDDVVSACFGALQKVHERDILIRDVNDGTFVIDGMDDAQKPIVASVVDFEFGVMKDDLVSLLTKYNCSRWYAQDDIGYALAEAQGGMKLDFDIAKKVERSIAARTILTSFFGDDWSVDLDSLSVEDQALYTAQLSRIKDGVKAYIEKEGLAETLGDMQEYITNRAMINITLPYFLQQQGAIVGTDIQTYLASALSPFLDERPSEPFVNYNL